MKHIQKAGLILFLGLCASGCSTVYHQVTIDEPHAILRFVPIDLSAEQYFEIQKIDGHSVRAKHSSFRHVRVRPGKHTLVFKKTCITYRLVQEAPFGGTRLRGSTHTPADSSPRDWLEPTERSVQFVEVEVNVESGKTYVFDQYGVMTSAPQAK